MEHVPSGPARPRRFASRVLAFIKGGTEIDCRLRRPHKLLLVVVLGLCVAVIEQTAQGVALVSDDVSRALTAEVHGHTLNLPASYVGIIPTTGRLVGLAILWRFRRRSRLALGVALIPGVVFGVLIAALMPGAGAMAGGLFISSIFSVSVFAIWSRVLDATRSEAQERLAGGLFVAAYTTGLWQLGELFDWLARKLGSVETLLLHYAPAIVIAGLLTWWLTPGESKDRRHVPGRLRDELARRERRPVLLLALLSALPLGLWDTQLTVMYLDLGLSRAAAADSGVAYPIGAAVSFAVTVLPISLWTKLVIAAAMLPLPFVIGLNPAAMGAAIGIGLGLIMTGARGVLEGTTSSTTTLAPLAFRGIAFMTVVQGARGLGNQLGSVSGAVSWDLGGRAALMAVGLGASAISIWISIRLMLAAKRDPQTYRASPELPAPVPNEPRHDPDPVPAAATLRFEGGKVDMIGNVFGRAAPSDDAGPPTRHEAGDPHDAAALADAWMRRFGPPVDAIDIGQCTRVRDVAEAVGAVREVCIGWVREPDGLPDLAVFVEAPDATPALAAGQVRAIAAAVGELAIVAVGRVANTASVPSRASSTRVIDRDRDASRTDGTVSRYRIECAIAPWFTLSALGHVSAEAEKRGRFDLSLQRRDDGVLAVAEFDPDRVERAADHAQAIAELMATELNSPSSQTGPTDEACGITRDPHHGEGNEGL